MAELTLTGMRVVYEVGARSSFTAAAGALGYSQSAVSRQVSLAEQAVGAKLFERGSRGVRPTPRGELLHPALEVKIREGGTDAQLRRLRAGRIDIGVIAAGAGLQYDQEDLK